MVDLSNSVLLQTITHMKYIYFICVISEVYVDQRLFYLLNMARHRVHKYAGHHADKALGVSIVQVGALLFVNENEGCLLNDMAKALDLNNSAVTGLANRLEQNQLVKRKPCPKDGRASRLYLTPLGNDKVSQAKTLITQFNQAMRGDFSEEEIQIIAKFLTHLITNFSSRETHDNIA